MLFKRFKNYKIKDPQIDIFGPECWPYVKDLLNQSKAQSFKLLPFACQYAISRIKGQNVSFDSKAFENFFIAIDPEQGRFLYSLVLGKKPRLVIEYGSSFGISTLYLATALKHNQQGRLLGTELETSKAKIASEHLEKCHCQDIAKIMVGDVRQTLASLNEPVDMVFMDGFPGLNLEVFNLLEPNMAPGCLILTDDVYLFKKEMQDYLGYLSNNPKFSSQILPISDGMLFTVKKPHSLKTPDSPYAAEDCAVTKQETYSKGLKS